MSIKKRSVQIAGHPTSLTMEEAFWEALHEIAQQKEITINRLITEIDQGRNLEKTPNLSSAVRVYVLTYYKGKSAQ